MSKMTLNATSALFDVNVWVALVLTHHAHNKQAVASLPAWPAPVFCRVTQAGVLRLFTNAAVMGSNVCDNSSAWKLYERVFADADAVFHDEPIGLEKQWKAYMTAQRAISANTWSDAYLAAFATCAQLPLLTFDQGFKRFAGLDCRIL